MRGLQAQLALQVPIPLLLALQALQALLEVQAPPGLQGRHQLLLVQLVLLEQRAQMARLGPQVPAPPCRARLGLQALHLQWLGQRGLRGQPGRAGLQAPPEQCPQPPAPPDQLVLLAVAAAAFQSPMRERFSHPASPALTLLALASLHLPLALPLR